MMQHALRILKSKQIPASLVHMLEKKVTVCVLTTYKRARSEVQKLQQ
jgi:hypothetical protein